MEKPVRSLIIRAILQEAISFEERSYRFYEKALVHASSGDAKTVLEKLLSQELSHRLLLEKVQKTVDLGLFVSEADEEGKAVDAIKKPLRVIPPGATKRQIMETALEKELRAVGFYDSMAERSRLRSVRRVFRKLAREEAGHVRLLRVQMAKDKGESRE